MTKRRARRPFVVEKRSIPPDRREARKSARPSKSPENPPAEPMTGMQADMARVPRFSTHGFPADFWMPSKD
jgi:hypothetical protein